MIRLRRRALPAPAVGMAPLIDCVFLLLIFFLVASRFSRHRAIVPESLALALPGAESSLPEEEDAILVSIAEGGEVSVGGSPVADGDLRTAIESAAAAALPDPRVLVVADRRTPIEHVTAAVDAARLAGVRSVAIATRSRREGSAGEGTP